MSDLFLKLSGPLYEAYKQNNKPVDLQTFKAIHQKAGLTSNAENDFKTVRDFVKSDGSNITWNDIAYMYVAENISPTEATRQLQELSEKFDAKNTDKELLKMMGLIEHGADINVKDNKDGYGRTPLHQASSNGYIEAIKLLLSNGANLNVKDQWGGSPLHQCSYTGETEAIKLLLSKGADINARDASNETPLHEASRNGKTEAVRLLLSNGAAIDTENDAEETPLHTALIIGHKEIIELLLSKNADIYRRRTSGLSGKELGLPCGGGLQEWHVIQTHPLRSHR
jgi:ankyrin repeat protein